MTLEEFEKEEFRAIKDRPFYIRKGQAVFNYIDEKYGVTRRLQDLGIDCFYDDENIREFIVGAYCIFINR